MFGVISDFNGGEGAVREIIEFILKAKNLWNDILTEYLSAELPEVKEKEPFYMVANKSDQITNQSNVPKQAQSQPTMKTVQTSTRPTIQPQKDENLEKLEKIGKKLNTKF